MALKDPQRRRLTVSSCDPAVLKAGRTVDGEKAARVEQNGLSEVFAEAAGQLCISVTSITDKDLKRKRSFADKDEEFLVPPQPGDKAAEEDLLEAGRTWLRDELKVSWSCKKGLKPESPNQDTFSIVGVLGKFALYGVYDGHGPVGHDVSDMAREVLVRGFFEHQRKGDTPDEAFIASFIETQVYIEGFKAVDSSRSGTTCTMAYHDLVTDILTVAHVGDSRGVLGWVRDKTAVFALDLTVDHKPDLPKERERIENADPPGRVIFDGFYNHRVFAQNGMYPGLNMSRALGDVIAHKEAGLTAAPDVKTLNLGDLRADLRAKHGPGELNLLLCTDGVWEFIESIESLKLVQEFEGTNAEACAKLATESWDRWMNDSDHEISDDITVIMARLG